MRALAEHAISFRSSSGVVLARVRLTPSKEATSDGSAPLVEIEDVEAREHGETTVQLRESERYEYEVLPENEEDLRLRCSLSTRRRSLGASGGPDAGLIETRTFCGTLLLELVQGPVDDDKGPVASALIDVRSLKLDYRTEYRGMLRRLAEEIAGLVADCRSSAKVGFQSSFEGRTDEGWLQLQLELLRETLDSSDFSSAMQRILTYPNERLTTVVDSVSTDRPIRWTPLAIRQLVSNNPRRAIPAGHPLRATSGLETVAEWVSLPHKSRDLDTAENRFVKFALGEFRAFLTHAQVVFESCKGWGASAALAKRLAGQIEEWLGRSLFREVGLMNLPPFGSPVLQRKAGYREVLRWWLRFRTAAELSWEGGDDVFKAGQRDVASLYEYWLFFELLDWFYHRCAGGNRPAVEELIEGLDEGSPNLRLCKRIELGPFVGVVDGGNRKLNARFSYNKRFGPTKGRAAGGSWTRALHPDYTLTFWPQGIDEQKAEREELLVHIHFDAKYRVENIEGLFGAASAEDADDEADGNYKRQDLLKMHAYRDAIKRSQGAYVLYPGQASSLPVRFEGFHEILPGLGAFGVSPDSSGRAQGMDRLALFLDETLAHLCDRTTAQERGSFHLMESYRSTTKSAHLGGFPMPELDNFGDGYRALPPAEHMVMVACGYDKDQLAWIQANKLAIVPLGPAAGAWRLQAELPDVRHLLLGPRGGALSGGLWRMTVPGCRVLSNLDLASIGYPSPSPGEVHAMFDVASQRDWEDVVWSRKKTLRAIREFDGSAVVRFGKDAAAHFRGPRVVSLLGLLKAHPK
ncbi:DUF2357 domain-containing protein [Caenimonas soli]|uniref:DUF2357 domain-containing protein n=1 Tax=Caenimonas soli TaxID=2735555 RepID=UPI0015550D95|nr:DUF2357 domain-containing protein [Caenimonas soli]NPC55189.1 DUF2357 domain-containing protein [Caenimonas soli]